MMIKYIYDHHKAIEAAVWTLSHQNAPVTSLKLIELLYLAERESLCHNGFPLMGDLIVSTDQGPILAQTSALANGNHDNAAMQGEWNAHIHRSHSSHQMLVSAVKSTSTKNSADKFRSLSESDRDILDTINATYGTMTAAELLELSYELPEWKNPHGVPTPINPANMLQAVGMSPEQIAALSIAAQERYGLHQILARPIN